MRSHKSVAAAGAVQWVHGATAYAEKRLPNGANQPTVARGAEAGVHMCDIGIRSADHARSGGLAVVW